MHRLNNKLDFCDHKSLLLDNFLNQPNIFKVHTLKNNFPKMHSNITYDLNQNSFSWSFASIIVYTCLNSFTHFNNPPTSKSLA